MKLTDNQMALVALVLVAIVSAFAATEAKDILLTVAGGIVGWMSKSHGEES